MKIVQQYSHLNGLEYLLVHHKRLWKEIKEVIEQSTQQAVNQSQQRKNNDGEIVGPVDMNKVFVSLHAKNWQESRVS